MPDFKQYLGDSVYASVEKGMICLTTENGAEPSNTIYLEPEVYAALLRWVQWVKEQPQPKKEQDKCQS